MFNHTNFWDGTVAHWVPTNEIPEVEPFYTSMWDGEISSEYWHGNDSNGNYVIRRSQHWNKVSNCIWTIEEQGFFLLHLSNRGKCHWAVKNMQIAWITAKCYYHTMQAEPTLKQRKIEVLQQEGFVEEVLLLQANLEHLIDYTCRKDDMGFVISSEEFNRKEFLKAIMRSPDKAVARHNWDTKVRPHLLAFHKAIKEGRWSDAKTSLQLAANAGEDPAVIAGLQTHIRI